MVGQVVGLIVGSYKHLELVKSNYGCVNAEMD